MSSPPPPPPPLVLLLLTAVASAGAGPVDLLEDTLAPAPATPLPPVVPPEQAVPAATLVPPTEGQYCTVEGEVFHNGERLPLSGSDPCRACYCQGGESVCTRVHCYRRADCAPRHVAGRCCPKYDNCPAAQEDRSPEPRFKDASTQTEADHGAPTSLPTVTETDFSDTSSTETITATAGTATSAVTTEASTLTSAASTETSWSATEGTEAPAPTDSLPPGIDLHALHEHLPFLSPGDANGPNT